MPELIVEVCSDYNRWLDVLRQVAEYLNAGVRVVCMVDPRTQKAYVYCADEPPRVVAVMHGFFK